MATKGSDKYVFYDEDVYVSISGEIGARITKERERQNISCSKLAAMCNLNYSLLYRAERGGSIKLKNMIKICSVLNRPVGYFVPFNEDEIKKTSLGDKFEKIVKDLSSKDVNIVLNMIQQICDFKRT